MIRIIRKLLLHYLWNQVLHVIGYVDNQVISQSERLFKLFQFIKRYTDKHLIIIVDRIA
jgi:hypothetical protein